MLYIYNKTYPILMDNATKIITDEEISRQLSTFILVVLAILISAIVIFICYFVRAVGREVKVRDIDIP